MTKIDDTLDRSLRTLSYASRPQKIQKNMKATNSHEQAETSNNLFNSPKAKAMFKEMQETLDQAYSRIPAYHLSIKDSKNG